MKAYCTHVIQKREEELFNLRRLKYCPLKCSSLYSSSLCSLTLQATGGRKYLKGYHFFFNKERENELMARGVSNDE